MDPEYARSLDNNFGGLGNIGGRAVDSITAATLLSKFTNPYTWASLDIAGAAWNRGAKGAPRWPVGPLPTSDGEVAEELG